MEKIQNDWEIETIENGGNSDFGIIVRNNGGINFSMLEPVVQDLRGMNIYTQNEAGINYLLDFHLLALVNTTNPIQDSYEFPKIRDFISVQSPDDSPNAIISIIDINTGVVYVNGQKTKGTVNKEDKEI